MSKILQQEMIQALTNLAIDLSHTPTMREFNDNSKYTKHIICREFGSYTVLIQAAGLDPIQQQARYLSNKIFEKDIEKHLEQHEPTIKTPYEKMTFTPTVILGDTHFPFIHQDKLKKAIELIEKIKPKRIIQVGDLYDCMSHAKFPRSMNIYTPKEEMNLARKGAQDMWKQIQSKVKNTECYQILGNHDSRPMKRILEQYPEIEMFVDFEKWFTFDGVNTQMDIRKELILDGIAYIHGHKSRLGEHMEFMRRSVVCGHSHRPGIDYKNYGDQVLFEMNVGYLGDPEAKALSYTAQKHTHWSHGVGLINENGPQFIML